ncbi:MAG: hypothetical protein ACI4HI_06060 [Lachnospiraceae bacterium]
MPENSNKTNHANITEEKLRMLMFEVIAAERKNVRTKEKTDREMVVELRKIIQGTIKRRY